MMKGGDKVNGKGKEKGKSTVYVYGASWCGFCQKAKRILEATFAPDHQTYVPIPDRKAASHYSVRPKHKRLLQNIKTIPAVFIGDSYLGGCDSLQDFVNKK